MLEDLLPDAPEAPRHSWAELQPLLEGGFVTRVGFTPVITPKGYKALKTGLTTAQAMAQPTEFKELQEFNDVIRA